MPTVTRQFLLEGAHYALMQCGELLHSATLLYKAGHYAGAIGLAALAHEEMGRFRILKDKREAVVQGQSVSLKELRKTCEDHLQKQRWGMVSDVISFSRNSELGKLLEEGEEEGNRKIEEIINQRRRALPDRRHQQRMKAFYVEPNEAGTGWKLPWELTQGEAGKFIQVALIDYALQVNRNWTPQVIRIKNSELAAAIEAWRTRPDLPLVPWLDR